MTDEQDFCNQGNEPGSVPTPTIEHHLSGDATEFDAHMSANIAALDDFSSDGPDQEG